MDLSSLYSAAGAKLETPPPAKRAPDETARLLSLSRQYGIDHSALVSASGDEVLTDEELHALCRALQDARTRQSGAVPASYVQQVQCAGCGLVWLWEGLPAQVAACPWCLNRAAGLPIPRPVYVRCADCGAFERDRVGDGNGIGDCSRRARPEPPAWPNVSRACLYWIPQRQGGGHGG